MKTLENFEKSLGRKIIWSPRYHPGRNQDNRSDVTLYENVQKLRLYPHAFRDANAYYDSDKKAILFGYFEAASKTDGTNLPGGVIFTCLSPDIIAHEVTHAILDSIHPRFLESTNPDVAAFHEAFSDIVALLQRFTIPALVEHQISGTRGSLEEFSFLGELATQFGNALEGNRGALRGAIGQVNSRTGKWEKYKPDPDAYHTIYEPHDRGALLVATIFDAFIRIYNNQTADLLRIATNGTGILQPGAIHPDLVKRLAGTACEIAERLLHICIRALDYCPPLDINFGDYLRALITADLDSSPKDTNGYRIALIEAFRSWGIYPDRVNTLSIESLQWNKPDQLTAREKMVLNYTAQFLKDKVRNLIEISMQESDNRSIIYEQSRALQGLLHDYFMIKKRSNMSPGDWSAFMKKIGLTDERVSFKYDGEEISSRDVPKLEVHKIRPVYRVGREGKLVEQVIVTLTQKFDIRSGELEGARFRGGCTLIINMSNDFNVEYVIYKNINSNPRFTYQMDYQQGKTALYASLSDSMYEEGGAGRINFAQLHFH